MKNDPLNLFLNDIKDHPLYPALLQKLKNNRPAIPPFDIGAGNDDVWKLKTGMQQGFDLCLSLLNIKLEN